MNRQIEEAVFSAGSVAIMGHIHPDGDSIGACLALKRVFSTKYPEKDVRVFLEPFLAKFGILEGAEAVCHDFGTEFSPDLCVVLDCAEIARIGGAQRYYDAARTRICIDHHITNPGFGDLSWVAADASSACELLYTLLDEADLDRVSAECLYVGIVHDTNVFRNPNTTERTMEIAGHLLTMGVDAARIIDETFDKKTFRQIRAMGTALSRAQLLLDGRMIAAVMEAEDLERLGVEAKDLDGIVAQLRATEGVEAAAFLYAIDGGYKVSLRANKIADVSRIATRFGGGGHKRAAGFDSDAPAAEILETVEALIKEDLDAWTAP